jgi:hypothetical protein
VTTSSDPGRVALAAPQAEPLGSRTARGLAVLLGLSADTSAALVVLTVVPLVLLQMPNLIAAAVPSMIASLGAGTGGAAGPGTGTGPALLRAAGLALPAMVLASPPAAVAARRGGAWPVLLGGLAMLGLADAAGNFVGVRLGGAGGPAGSVTGGATGLVAGVGIDRVAHGLGAGLAAAGTVALLWGRGGAARRLLACLWAAVAACTLVAAVPLIWPRLSDGGWRALLQPYPQLTGAALAVTAVHLVLARAASMARARYGDGPGERAGRALAGSGGRGPGDRGRSPLGRSPLAPAERAQLAMLSVPVAGLSGLTVAATFGWPPRAQLAAGVLAAVVLAALGVALSRDAVTGGGLCFPLVALAAGLVAAPSAAAVAGLRPPVPAGHAAPAHSLLGHALPAHGLLGRMLAALPADPALVPVAAAAAAALACGAAGWVAVLSGRRLAAAPAIAVMAGLTAAGAGLLLLQLAPQIGHHAPAVPPPRTLAMAFALVAGGLALALGPALAEAPSGGALAGVPLMLAGALTGYLIAGAIRIGLLPGSRRAATGPAVLHSLGGAAGTWELAAAGLAVAAVLGVLVAGRARRATVRAHRAG